MEPHQPAILLDDAEIPIVRVFQPAVDVNAPKKYIAYQGAQSVVWQKISTTSLSNSQLTWQVNTPSVKTGINRHCYVAVTARARLVGGDGNAIPAANFDNAVTNLGMRNFPLQSSCDTASLDLNSSRFSWNPRYILPAMYAYNVHRTSQRTFFSVAGGLPEQYSSYINPNVDDPKQAMASYGANTAQPSRHIRNFSFIKVGGANDGTFEVSWMEPVLLPPLATSARESPCLFGINNFNLNFVMGDLGRLFSVRSSPGAAADLGTVDSISIVSSTLHLQYYTFNLQYPLPQTPVWSVSDITSQVNEIAQIGPIRGLADDNTTTNGITNTTVTRSLNLNQIPKAIYVFGRRRQGVDNAGTPDHFLRLTKISVEFNNRSGLLSTLDEFDIYNMGVKNGLQMSWAQVQRVGMPLCLLPAEDLSLGDDQAPGLIGQFNFQMEITFAAPLGMDTLRNAGAAGGNNLRYPIVNNFDIYVCPVYEGVAWLNSSGLLMTKFGCLTELSIISAPIEFNTYEKYVDSTLYGGDLWGKVKNFVGRAFGAFKKALPVATSIAENIAPAIAASHPRASEALGKAASVGRALGGAKNLTRAQLKKRLQK